MRWKTLSRLQKGLNAAELSGSDSFDHADSKSGFRFFLKLFWLTLALYQDEPFLTELGKHTMEVAYETDVKQFIAQRYFLLKLNPLINGRGRVEKWILRASELVSYGSKSVCYRPR